MKRLLVILLGVAIALAISAAFGAAFAAGEKVLIQGEDYVAEGGGTLEVIEGRIDAVGGKNFRNWDNADHWAEWKFDIPVDGKYRIVIRYAAGADPPIRKIAIDGSVLPGFDAHEFQLTGGWCKEENQWVNYTLRTGTKDAIFDLKAGSHVLRMTNLGETANGMNIDVIGFLAADVKADVLGPASVAQE